MGIYQVEDNAIQPLPLFHNNVGPLGYTADGEGLYIRPYGQDPEFRWILLYDLQGQEFIQEVPVEGYGIAELTLDGRLLTTAPLPTASPTGESTLHIYNLQSLPEPPLQTIYPLPFQPSYIRGFRFSSDGTTLYFLLNPGQQGDTPNTSYGLWRLDIELGEISQIAEIATEVTESFLFIEDMSPDGEWLLLRHEREDLVLLIHLSTGESQYFTIPLMSLFVGWR